jgi:cold shock CspA family protein
MNYESRSGVVSTFISTSGFGFLLSQNEDGTQEKFYLHITRVKSGTPVPGATVNFDVLPVKEGKCRAAINAVVTGGAE